MTSLISESLSAAINEQIGAEKYNSHLYLFIAAFLKNKGLDNLGKIFEEQHDEEQGHAKMLYSLMTDLNADVAIPEIQAVEELGLNTINDIAKLYVDREIATTNSLKEIRDLAIEEENPVVEEALRKLISIQQSEYSESTSFADRAELTGGSWQNVLLWDLSLGD